MSWTGKPEFKPYLLHSLISLIGQLVFIGTSYGLFYLIGRVEGEQINWVYIHGFSIFIGGRALYMFYKRLAEFKNLKYEVTNSGIKITRGGLDRDTKLINLEKIQFVEVKTYLSDKPYGTKTVRIYTGEVKNDEDGIKKTFDVLESIYNSDKITTLLNVNK